MLAYKPIGYYNDAEDIIDLFPNATLKGDEADMVVKYMQDGYGAFHTIDHPDLDGYISVNQAKEYRLVLTADKKHAVSFSMGNLTMLLDHNDQHGYYIDIYELVDEPELDGEAEISIEDMSYDDLTGYALDLTEKLKHTIFEIRRRDACNLM